MQTQTLDTGTALNQWFDDLVSTLRVHEVALERGVADEQTSEMYTMLMRGNSDEMALNGKRTAQKHFVTNIIVDYLKGSIEGTADVKVDFRKLAFSFNDSEVLVWAEIADDREDLEKALIMAEARINAKYHDFGFDMNTTVVEESDYLPVPSHYLSMID